MSTMDQDSDDLVIIETVIATPEEPASIPSNTKKRRVSEVRLAKPASIVKTKPRTRKSVASPGNPVLRQNAGARVKNIVLPGQRCSSVDKNSVEEPGMANQENKNNQERTKDKLPLVETNDSGITASTEVHFIHNRRVGTVNADDEVVAVGLKRPASPDIGLHLFDYTEGDRKVMNQALLERGAFDRFRKLLFTEGDTNAVPQLTLPALSRSQDCDSVIENMHHRLSKKAPAESSFFSHKLYCLASYTMDLYFIKESFEIEKIGEMIDAAVDEELHYSGFITTMNDFFEEVNGIHFREPQKFLSDPIYARMARSHEVRLEYIRYCFIEPISEWYQIQTGTASPELSFQSPPTEPFAFFSKFVRCYIEITGLFKHTSATVKLIDSQKNVPVHICRILNETLAMLSDLVSEWLAMINQITRFVWLNASVIYDHFLTHGNKHRPTSAQIESVNNEYQSILKSFQDLTAGKIKNLLSFTGDNIKLIERKFVNGRGNEANEQEEPRIDYNDINESMCNVIFKQDDKIVKEWQIGLDESLDGIFMDLFGDDNQRKLYFDGTKVSRNLTARENGFFAGINYVSLHESDKLPTKLPEGIIIRFSSDESKNICISYDEVKLGKVGELVERVCKEIGATTAYQIVINGFWLKDKDWLSDYITEYNNVVDFVPISMCS